MSPSASLDLDVLAPEAVPGVRLLPILHDRVDLAALVRGVLAALDPAAVAVELPTTLAAAAERAVARLPRISLVVSEEPGEEALVWAVCPGDPLAEALRWAAERGRQRFLVDPDVPYLDRHPDPLPDPHALWELGPEALLSSLAAGAADAPASDADLRREGGMAYHLQRAREQLAGGTLLALVGAAHARRLAGRLAAPAAIPLARTRRAAVEVRHLHPESLTALLPDPPLAHAVYERLRRAEAAPEEGGEPLPPPPPLSAVLGRPFSLVRDGLRLLTRAPESWDAGRRRRLVDHATHGAARPGPGGLAAPDRWRLGGVVWRVAAGSWRQQTEAEPAPWQRRLFFDFARRYARLEGLLVPGLYEWVVAARGVADDNLAWEVFETARTYPWQEESAELPTARVDGSELDLGTRKVRFRRRFFRVKQRPVAIPVRRRPAPDDPAEWLEGFTGERLCSYPPEDLVVEDYGRYLKARAVGLLAAEQERSEPFTGSFLDGVDLRETLHHWAERRWGRPPDRKPRIWVRERGRAPGEAGSVVMIFDRDPDGRRFPHLMTWLGEHDEESDMAFYSTHPAEQVVGPGIMRATYGAFMMTWPPGRVYDVWIDPEYRPAGTAGRLEKAEVLIRAAIDYSREKLVVHAAARPPAPDLARYAAARGKRLVHVPLGSLSPPAIKKLRTLHVLSGRDKRAIAREYVW